MSALLIARRKAAAVVFSAFCWFAALVSIAALAAILWSLVGQGASGINVAVFTQNTPAPGSPGGLLNAIVGSVELCSAAMILAIVVGVLAGTWLAEYGRNTPYAQAVRFVNDILLSAPSVLVGLFVYNLMVAHLIGHFSAIAGAVALALIAAPIITRTTEDVLKLQPAALGEAGLALGTPKWSVIREILWRSAGPGILTGALLAFARISGETAPLLFTALNNQFFSVNPTQPIASLPAVIFQFALSAYDDWVRLAWAGALIVAVAVLGANVIARALSRETNRS